MNTAFSQYFIRETARSTAATESHMSIICEATQGVEVRIFIVLQPLQLSPPPSLFWPGQPAIPQTQPQCRLAFHGLKAQPGGSSRQMIAVTVGKCSVVGSDVVIDIVGPLCRHLRNLVYSRQPVCFPYLAPLTTTVNPEGLDKDIVPLARGVDIQLVARDGVSAGSTSGLTNHPHLGQVRRSKSDLRCG